LKKLAALKELKEYVVDKHMELIDKAEQERLEILETFKDAPIASPKSSNSR